MSKLVGLSAEVKSTPRLRQAEAGPGLPKQRELGELTLRWLSAYKAPIFVIPYKDLVEQQHEFRLLRGGRRSIHSSWILVALCRHPEALQTLLRLIEQGRFRHHKIIVERAIVTLRGGAKFIDTNRLQIKDTPFRIAIMPRSDGEFRYLISRLGGAVRAASSGTRRRKKARGTATLSLGQLVVLLLAVSRHIPITGPSCWIYARKLVISALRGVTPAVAEKVAMWAYWRSGIVALDEVVSEPSIEDLVTLIRRRAKQLRSRALHYSAPELPRGEKGKRIKTLQQMDTPFIWYEDHSRTVRVRRRYIDEWGEHFETLNVPVKVAATPQELAEVLQLAIELSYSNLLQYGRQAVPLTAVMPVKLLGLDRETALVALRLLKELKLLRVGPRSHHYKGDLFLIDDQVVPRLRPRMIGGTGSLELPHRSCAMTSLA